MRIWLSHRMRPMCCALGAPPCMPPLSAQPAAFLPLLPRPAGAPTCPPNAKHRLSTAISASMVRVLRGGSRDVASSWSPSIASSLIRAHATADAMHPVATMAIQPMSCTFCVPARHGPTKRRQLLAAGCGSGWCSRAAWRRACWLRLKPAAWAAPFPSHQPNLDLRQGQHDEGNNA